MIFAGWVTTGGIMLVMMIRILVAALAIAGATGCWADDPETRSNTPRVTVDEGRSGTSAVLLTAEDVNGIEGFERLTSEDLGQVPIFENPDPRGPCGGVVPDLPLPDAVGRAFTRESFGVFEMVTEASQRSDAYLHALRSDSLAGACGPYESETNTGATQRVRDVRILDLHALPGDAVGWTSTIEVQGQVIEGGAIAIESNGWIAFVQFQGVDLPPIEAVVELATRAADRLAG